MKGILVTSKGCPPCAEMKTELAPLISSGEVELVDFEEEPERATELMNKYGANIPGLIILGDNGQVVAIST